MRKFKGNESPAHENHPGRQVVARQERGTGRKLVGPGKRQRHGPGAGGQDEKPGLERLLPDHQRFGVFENGRPLDELDARAFQPGAGARRNRVGKSILLRQHRRPVRCGGLHDPLAFQMPGAGHGFRGLVEILLGLAAGQGANPPGRRAVLHHGHLETVLA